MYGPKTDDVISRSQSIRLFQLPLRPEMRLLWKHAANTRLGCLGLLRKPTLHVCLIPKDPLLVVQCGGTPPLSE